MSSIEHWFQEFVDAIQTANDDDSFERVATRVTQRLGFRWFAYLRIVEDAPKLISSYPKSWTSHYFDLHYEQLDRVVRRARLEHDLFSRRGLAHRRRQARESNENSSKKRQPLASSPALPCR
jgi:LuxR family transcriptional activator of conjugal transfer of Ti plasmids